MRNKLLRILRYSCLLCVIAFGLIAIIGSNGGDGDNEDPIATITSPSGSSSYTEGETITFSGTGSDAEDGTLSASSLVWTSSIDDQIGTGTSFTGNDMSVGIHTITLTATDSDGATGNASISIVVEIFPSPINVNAILGNTQVTISWNSVPGATSYNIYWSTTTGVSITFNEGKISGVTRTSYTHSGRVNGTTYYYVVTAENDYEESDKSSEVSATPSDLTAPRITTPPNINGIVDSSEWSSASSYNLNLINSAGDLEPSTWYFMNDGNYIYIGVKTETTEHWDTMAGIGIDGNNDNYASGNPDSPHQDFTLGKACSIGWSGHTHFAIWVDDGQGGCTGTHVSPPSDLERATYGSSDISYEFKIPISPLNTTTYTIAINFWLLQGGLDLSLYQFFYPDKSDVTNPWSNVTEWPRLNIE